MHMPGHCWSFKRQSQRLLRINPKHVSPEYQGDACTKMHRVHKLCKWLDISGSSTTLGKPTAHVPWLVHIQPLAPGADTIRSSHSLLCMRCMGPSYHKASSPLNLSWAWPSGWQDGLSLSQKITATGWSNSSYKYCCLIWLLAFLGLLFNMKKPEQWET